MAIDRVPSLKRCRALGLETAVVGLAKSSKRQPKRSGRKVSEYGMQLKEKQKAKFIYGVLEKQFRAYYDKAKTMPGVTGENLLGLLERRIDNVVFRLGLASTRRQARQLVSHGHITVNGKRLDIPSALIKVGDVIGDRLLHDVLAVDRRGHRAAAGTVAAAAHQPGTESDAERNRSHALQSRALERGKFHVSSTFHDIASALLPAQAHRAHSRSLRGTPALPS